MKYNNLAQAWQIVDRYYLNIQLDIAPEPHQIQYLFEKYFNVRNMLIRM